MTGLYDPGLTPAGRDAARQAGNALRRADLLPDQVWTSSLARARETAALIAHAGGFTDDSATVDGQLDERGYGCYSGRPKSELVEELGQEGYLRLRRNVDLRPPPMTEQQRERLRRARAHLKAAPEDRPEEESLADVLARVATFHRDRLVPALILTNRTLLVVAHGDRLRALRAVIEHVNPNELRDLALPRATPLVYRFDWLLRTEHRESHLQELVAPWTK